MKTTSKTFKAQLKERIAYYCGKGESIALLESIPVYVDRTDGYDGLQRMDVSELYRDGRGVACISDGINYRTVHSLSEKQCFEVAWGL